MARDWELTPSASLEEVYTDRIFGSSEREGGLISNLSAAISIRSQSPDDLLALRYQISWPAYFFTPESPNGLDHRLSLSDQVELTSRFKVKLTGSLAVIPDNSLFYARTMAERSGSALIPQSDMVQDGAGAAFEYETGPLNLLNFGYLYSATWYEEAVLFDSATQEFSLGNRFQISEISSRRFSYSYSHARIKNREDSAIHSGTFSHHWSPEANLSGSITTGISFSTEDHRFHPSYGGSISQVQSYGGLSLSAMRRALPGGGLIPSSTVTDSVILQLSRQISEELDFQLQESYSGNRSVAASAAKTRTLTTATAIIWRFTPHWSGTLSYEYINQKADGTAFGDFSSSRFSGKVSWQGEPWR